MKPSKIATIVLGAVGVLALGYMAYALIASKGRTKSPIRLSVRYEPVTVPETRVWVSALEHQLSPEQFEEVVKTNREGRDFALGLFAYNDMTNHVRILVMHARSRHVGGRDGATHYPGYVERGFTHSTGCERLEPIVI
jgi:hypothetical protein